ncbi:pseudouridine-5'-phosphatase [Aplysia californica]|uniref:Pseudouridine-5'-phosphatase n=1 Tax=Aplysia californica TaxID=6500 RepID=A0ABM0K542_APLCA|nr:pseudouridine-5'-phosphatase [Aplysia californica]
MDSPAVKITHVIFDVDGLIIDTERVYTECLEEICAEYGCEFTWEIKSQQMGKKEREAAQVLIDALKIPMTVDEYVHKLKARLEVKLPSVPLMPGAEKLIRHLHNNNIPIALASGSDGWGFKRKTAGHKELFALFHHTVLSSDDPDVKHGKPAPDCFLVAAKRFGDDPNPAEILVFEDAPNGAEAGVAAGMHVVWVPDPRADRTVLQDRVDQTLDSLEQFRPERFGLPAYSESV